MSSVVSALALLIICCVGLSAGRVVHRISDYNKPMAEPVRQCRTICLAKHLHDAINNVVVTDECTDRPNCFMCWDYCKILHEEKRIVRDLMCSDGICYSGCKTACMYYTNFFSDFFREHKHKLAAAGSPRPGPSVPTIVTPTVAP
ncbi:uncharacterized protein LOC128269903 [Anopheles cruzii]|uniref:uncharacterized protein LOC128269903 n=1 Tax=Anopheles cruzii TaxID=68878 RepID=UPI0022EC8301|nr:uncharacterized protein LOC128269903 [Anopheles cruzii]